MVCVVYAVVFVYGVCYRVCVDCVVIIYVRIGGVVECVIVIYVVIVVVPVVYIVGVGY